MAPERKGGWRWAFMSVAIVLFPSLVNSAELSGDPAFFAGKRLTYIVATSPGGGYDNYARLIARYLPRHLGVRSVAVKNIPGASHLIGLNSLVNAKPDGLTIATFNSGLLMSPNPLSIDVRNLSWVGKAASETRIFVVARTETGLTFEDLRQTGAPPLLYATSGLLGASHLQMKLIGEGFGLNIRPIHGFSGSETQMAVLRGDLTGGLMSLTRVESAILSGKMDAVFYIGHPKPAFPVPSLHDFARTPVQESLAEQLDAMTVLGRLTAAPPGLPPSRLSALRAAYLDTLSDVDLRREAERLNMPLAPWNGTRVASEVDKLPPLAAMASPAPDSDSAGAQP